MDPFPFERPPRHGSFMRWLGGGQKLANSTGVEYRRVIPSSSKKVMQDFVGYNEVSYWGAGDYGFGEIDVMRRFPLTETVTAFGTREGRFGNLKPLDAPEIALQAGTGLHLFPVDAILRWRRHWLSSSWGRDWIEAPDGDNWHGGEEEPGAGLHGAWAAA